jgi:hypothetical protein
MKTTMSFFAALLLAALSASALAMPCNQNRQTEDPGPGSTRVPLHVAQNGAGRLALVI